MVINWPAQACSAAAVANLLKWRGFFVCSETRVRIVPTSNSREMRMARPVNAFRRWNTFPFVLLGTYRERVDGDHHGVVSYFYPLLLDGLCCSSQSVFTIRWATPITRDIQLQESGSPGDARELANKQVLSAEQHTWYVDNVKNMLIPDLQVWCVEKFLGKG